MVKGKIPNISLITTTCHYINVPLIQLAIQSSDAKILLGVNVKQFKNES